MYRLLALDLDGTLLRNDGRVDDRDIAAIREVRAAGVTVTIVTGRLQSGAPAAAEACEIAGPIACVEGSHLVDVDDRRDARAPRDVGTSVTALLRDAFGAHGLASFVFEADGIHHDRAGEPYADYVRTWSPNLRVVEEVLDEHVWSE